MASTRSSGDAGAWLALAAAAPVGRLATLRPAELSGHLPSEHLPSEHLVDLVPFVFAWLPDPAPLGRIVHAVDHKPKRHRRLQRLANVAAEPRVTVLVDHYEDDWARLWWVRLRGVATVSDTVDPAALDALVAKYPPYRQIPPQGPMMSIQVDTVQGWSAAGVIPDSGQVRW